MDPSETNSKPGEAGPSDSLNKIAGGKLLLWVAVGSAMILVIVLFFTDRLRRVENQMRRLSAQVEENNRKIEKAGQKTDAVLERALLAEQYARQAVQQRNQAIEAKTKSEQRAQVAEQQAETAQQVATLAQQKAEEYRKQREEELARLQQVLGQIAETRRTAMGLVMTLGNDSIRFDFDKSEVKPQYRDLLNRIAGALMTLKGYSIYVYGYTDDVGTPEYNQKLSERRARAVRKALVEAGLDPKIITAKGFGESDPRVTSSAPQARAVNRRVEIGIVDARLLLHETPPPED
jgi:outer membrane protein OmpA-like peptidoglycan-associated protein